MAPGLYLPGAKFRPVSYRAEAGKFTHAPLGWILHVVVGNGSPFNTFENAKSPSRRFSHGWVAKNGSSEQYQTLDMKSWAQGTGNGDYWSFETEGFPEEPLTNAQIETLARWHRYLGAPDLIATSPGKRGIGTHFMGGSAWGGHSCPDPVGKEGKGPRSLQRDDIIRVSNGDDDMPLSDDDITKIAEKVWNIDTIPAPAGTPVATNPDWTPASYLKFGYDNLNKVKAAVTNPTELAKALAAALPSGQVTQEELETALRNVLGSLND